MHLRAQNFLLQVFGLFFYLFLHDQGRCMYLLSPSPRSVTVNKSQFVHIDSEIDDQNYLIFVFTQTMI